LIVAFGIWLGTGHAPRTVGRVTCLYGNVAVQKNGSAQSVTRALELRSGQRVKTEVGSKAQILLPDQSQVVPEPRTSLQIAETRQGPRIQLESGTIGIAAAKQPPGKAITILSGRSEVKVLGTRLDVRLVERPSGTRQTVVRVLSGKVEMESAGQKVTLLAGTEGAAEEGRPPVRTSMVPEVNELIRLLQETRELAARTGRRYGPPEIIDLTTGTIWAVVPGNAFQMDARSLATVRLKYGAFGAQAYTTEGAGLPAQGSGEVLRVDLSGLPGPSVPERLILKVPGVGGLLIATGSDSYACQLPPGGQGEPSLLQLRLPASAEVEKLSPSAGTTVVGSDEQIITVVADISLPLLK
jgi:hypothetical protein